MPDLDGEQECEMGGLLIEKEHVDNHINCRKLSTESVLRDALPERFCWLAGRTLTIAIIICVDKISAGVLA
jgi:hypothetical protein